MKKLLTIPGAPERFVVETDMEPWGKAEMDRWNALNPDCRPVIVWQVPRGIGKAFPAAPFMLSDVPKKKLHRLKSAGFMIDDAIERGWWEDAPGGGLIRTPSNGLYFRWFFQNSGKQINDDFEHRHGIPPEWIEEVEVEG